MKRPVSAPMEGTRAGSNALAVFGVSVTAAMAASAIVPRRRCKRMDGFKVSTPRVYLDLRMLKKSAGARLEVARIM